jgi:hypothetical protein
MKNLPIHEPKLKRILLPLRKRVFSVGISLGMAFCSLSPSPLGAEDHGGEKKKEEKKEKKPDKKLSPAEIQSKFGGVAEPLKDSNPTSNFIALDPFIISVIRDHTIQAVLSFIPTLELSSPAFRAAFYEKIYPIRDEVFKDLYSVLGALWIPGTELNTDTLKKRTEKIIAKHLPLHAVKNVLFQKISIHYPKKPLVTHYLNPSTGVRVK